MNIFVGSEKNPTFLVEINKNITVYKPDKYSKNEDPYEKYSLGEIILQTSFDSVIYKRLTKYNIPGYPIKAYITPELIIRIKDKYICITNKLIYIFILLIYYLLFVSNIRNKTKIIIIFCTQNLFKQLPK